MEDIIRLQRATVDDHIRAENAHNWPAVHNTFVQDESAFYDVVPLHAHFSGFWLKSPAKEMPAMSLILSPAW